MIFIIPIILGAAALITAGIGVASGIDAVSKMDEAKKIGEEAQRLYEQKIKSVEANLKKTNDLAEKYGQIQIEVKYQTIRRFVALIERIGQQASQSDTKFLEGLDGVSPQQIKEYKQAALEAEHLATGGFKALGAAYAAGQGTVALVGLFGTASTGAAIGGLSGVAAWNATLAWLGGGSLAAGGGGMALGSMVLGGIAIGPALMIGGFVLGGQGEKALTDAHRYKAEANTEIEKLDAFEDILGQVQRRITELKDIVNTLNDRAIEGLAELESRVFVRSGFWVERELYSQSVNFNPERDAAKFQQVVILIKALVEIMKTPVLDAEGNLNQATATLKAKYRTI